MGKFLVAIEQLDLALRSAPSHPLLGSGSIHASLIEGGTELSTYPDRCLLRLERRTIPGETADATERQLRGIIDGLKSQDAKFKADVTRGLAREPFEVQVTEPIVEIVRRNAREITGVEPKIAGEFGWMDSAILSAAGIRTVIFGPGGDGAHADVEWVDLDDLETCRRVYLAAAREFCA
jgi:acetylornithine deacetylase